MQNVQFYRFAEKSAMVTSELESESELELSLDWVCFSPAHYSQWWNCFWQCFLLYFAAKLESTVVFQNFKGCRLAVSCRGIRPLVSSFCDDSKLHVSVFRLLVSTKVKNTWIYRANCLIGNWFHVTQRILSPKILHIESVAPTNIFPWCCQSTRSAMSNPRPVGRMWPSR